jgi:hypothetical protein
MSLFVTAQAYSQRANPSWVLSDKQEGQFNELLRSLRQRTLVKARGGAPIFGYRGLSVRRVPGGEPLFFVSQGIVDPGSHQASLVDQNRSVEAFLLETSGDKVDETLREEVRGALSVPAEELLELRLRRLASFAGGSDCPNANLAADAPLYNPSLWNDIDAVRDDNNCYSYANNQPLGRAPLPGRAHDLFVAYSSCGLDGIEEGTGVGAIKASMSDGLKPAPSFPGKLKEGDGWYVAARLSEKFDDCHWLRQDFAGCWSQKNGEDIVTNVDSDGAPITDPRRGNFGKYSIFCAILITNSRVTIS